MMAVPEPVVPVLSPEERRIRYNKLVRTASLSQVYLCDIDFNIKPETFFADTAKIKRSIKSQVRDVDYDQNEGICVANILWQLRVKSGKEKLVSCDARYIVVYCDIKDFPKDLIDIFAENVAKVTSYAYFRGVYAHLDWSAGANSPPLPVFRANPKV